jgi:hypothetical protein
VGKVTRSTLRKHITFELLNTKWKITKVDDEPDTYKVKYEFDYAPPGYLFVTDDTPIVPFKISLMKEFAYILATLVLVVWVMWELNGAGYPYYIPFVMSAPPAIIQIAYWIRYAMLYKQNKVYYSWL